MLTLGRAMLSKPPIVAHWLGLEIGDAAHGACERKSERVRIVGARQAALHDVFLRLSHQRRCAFIPETMQCIRFVREILSAQSDNPPIWFRRVHCQLKKHLMQFLSQLCSNKFE